MVCLANLLPASDEQDDIDSWMYQTVGHGVIQAYAACAGVPLLRKRISGRSVETRLSYLHTDGDEVEDLFALLNYAKKRFPDARGVCSGAIASDYQRTRVENVCSRLGLTSLAYLWRRPQTELLGGMIAAGVHAVLAKVAAVGLTPHKHLGKTLTDVERLLLRLRSGECAGGLDASGARVSF